MPLSVDRKTGPVQDRAIYVSRASLSIAGGIQPGILRDTLGKNQFASGLAARFLFAYPPRRRKRWTCDEVSEKTVSNVTALHRALYGLQPEVDSNGHSRPKLLRLTADAKRRWISFYDAHAEQMESLSGDQMAAWSKLEEYPARFALLFQLIYDAGGDGWLKGGGAVDDLAMSNAIALVNWFKHETFRIYALLHESEAAGQERRLIEWIRAKGGQVTVREVQQGHRRFRTAREATDALEALEAAGYGTLSNQQAGTGRPSSVFALSDSSFVDVDTEDQQELVGMEAVNG